MKMSELEKNLHEVRAQVEQAIHQLADAAIEDSSNYNEAIKKLKNFSWKLTGWISSVIIEAAIENVKERALNSTIEKNC